MSLSLSQIRGIGPARLKALNDAGIWTARDLALMLPRDYRDLTNVTPLAALQAGVPAAVRVRVSGEPREQRARKLLITKVFVTDGNEVAPVVWYNQPWLKKQLTVGRELLLYGKAEWKKGVLQLVSPTIEQEGGLIPVYRAIPGVPAKAMRATVEAALEACDGSWPEDLPESIRRRFNRCAAPIFPPRRRRWRRRGGGWPSRSCCCIRSPCG